MIAISLHIKRPGNLTESRWKQLATEVEKLGFSGLYYSDHYTNAFPLAEDSVVLIKALTHLAEHTQHIHFGPLIAPLWFRHPSLLARQAAELNDLSGGRLVLGVGTGWEERERQIFDLVFDDPHMSQTGLEEGLDIITRLLRSDQPITYDGAFFQLHKATLLPRPQQAMGPSILMGGNGIQRTLPLVARYADVWNGQWLSPQAFQERSACLDECLLEAGRSPREVKRTLYSWLHFGHTMEELDQVLIWRHTFPELAHQPLDEVLHELRTPKWLNRLVGTPEMLVEQIRAYADAGVEELVLPWFEQNNIALRRFAASILPRL